MQDEDKSIIRFLYIFMSVALVGSVLILIIGFLLTSYPSITLAGFASTVLCVTVLGLLRARKFTAAEIILPFFTYLIATYLIFTSNEVSVRDEAVLLYSLVVAMAGLLLGKRGVVVFGILSTVTVEASVYAEIQGWIVNHITAKTTIYATMVTSGVVYGLTFIVMYIMVDVLTKNLVKSGSNKQELLAANAQLITIQESLEQLVAARTRAAENARAQAEAARREAESQAWITRGQAQLAEQMRGELDIPILANNITSHLSQYIGAQLGALFIASGDVLKLMGRYSYVVRDGQASEFQVGEGLVGEAARSQKIIRVGEVPADAPLISSGLGESIPREILIAPIASNGQIFGVLEFGTLSQFTLEHETFLARISESAAIALRTAQTRAKMKQLL